MEHAQRPPVSLTPGSVVGPYEIVALLGVGGMGEVYRARDARLDRDVAIKVLPPEMIADAGRLARFDREARLLAALNHPNIAAIYGLEETGSIRALVDRYQFWTYSTSRYASRTPSKRRTNVGSCTAT
jgi:serine/threonine protein kinase